MLSTEQRMWPGRLIAALAWLCLLAPGCSDDVRVPLVPTSGTVLVDGQPAKGVEVRLHPSDNQGGLDALRPFGTTGEDGTFRLGIYEKGDGAPAGRYRITLFWPDKPPGPNPPRDLLGGRYADPAKSGLEAVVGESKATLEPIDIKMPARRPNQTPVRPRRPDPDGLGETPPV